MKIDPRLHDHAKDILSNAPLDDSTKATLWDHWHDARDVHELSTRLADMDIPSDVAESLIAAKKISEPEPAPTDKAVAVINHLSKLDKNVLDLAEAHPNVLRHIVNSITSKE
jgi:hypothetical protein